MDALFPMNTLKNELCWSQQRLFSAKRSGMGETAMRIKQKQAEAL